MILVPRPAAAILDALESAIDYCDAEFVMSVEQEAAIEVVRQWLAAVREAASESSHVEHPREFDLDWFLKARELFLEMWMEGAEDRRNGRASEDAIALKEWWTADTLLDRMTPDEVARSAIRAHARCAHDRGGFVSRVLRCSACLSFC